MRARHLKTFVDTIGELSHDARDRIHARLPEESFVAIEEALPSVWLPMELNVTLTDATSLELGTEGAHAFYRRMVLAEYETNTFKSFMATMNRLLGLTPSTYVKMAPRGWELVFKSCGKFRARERDAHSARLEYTAIPAVCMQNSLWIESVRSSFYTAFDVSAMQGDIVWEELDFKALRAVFLFRWE